MINRKKGIKWGRLTTLGLLIVLFSGLILYGKYTFIQASNLRITLNENIKFQIEEDNVTLYIPINSDVEKWKFWLGTAYFDKDTTVASKVLFSLDTSIPNEVVTTVVVNRNPVTLYFIVE